MILNSSCLLLLNIVIVTEIYCYFNKQEYHCIRQFHVVNTYEYVQQNKGSVFVIEKKVL